MTVAFHSRWMGRSGRISALRRIVEHMKQYDDVWFATREQIARHFAKEVPYDPEAFVQGTGRVKTPWDEPASNDKKPNGLPNGVHKVNGST